MGKLIGRGGFGTVHKALNVNTGQIVAIKRFHAAKITKSKLAAVMVRTLFLRVGGASRGINRNSHQPRGRARLRCDARPKPMCWRSSTTPTW